ncbi:MAG TPA: MOSC N-terminal beta barrel domain-containing protein [Kutzneria sp.]
MSVQVSALVSYPIKGCAGTTVRSAVVTPTGLRHDRAWMVVDADGVFRSQRNEPRLAVVHPTVVDGQLRVSAPDIEDLVLDVLPDGQRRAVRVHKWDGVGVDQGQAAADWFSEVLGAPSRLVGLPPEHVRPSSGETEGLVGFADAHALLVTSLASLDGLNERILARGAEPVPMARFRPNIVISGWRTPHTEDQVRRMSIGDAEFGYAKICVRCAVPMVDQDTGRRAGPEPIRSLAQYRRDPDGGVTFGMKAVVLRPGTLSVGDDVVVGRWSDVASYAAEPA